MCKKHWGNMHFWGQTNNENGKGEFALNIFINFDYLSMNVNLGKLPHLFASSQINPVGKVSVLEAFLLFIIQRGNSQFWKAIYQLKAQNVLYKVAYLYFMKFNLTKNLQVFE
jgi:hypothetical protein